MTIFKPFFRRNPLISSIISELIRVIRVAVLFNPEVQVAPACILWPDHDRQWESAIPRLQAEMPELLVLGDYAPGKRTGPAIWLRCVIAGKIEEVPLPEGHVPVLYLPGFSRQDLRAVESCPDHLKPLAELQYRGVIWSQINAKDWTILAFLKTDQGGLGLDVAQDNVARNAMQLALSPLLEEEVERLKGKHLDKDYFNTLLTGGDPVRDLLVWLDQGDAFTSSRSENEWAAFVEVCKSQFAFSPQDDGLFDGANKLAVHEGPWNTVWKRFCEAPKRYPNIPEQIRKCVPPVFDLFADADSAGSWPQWNEAQERILRKDLQALEDISAHKARSRLLELARKHGQRRHLVWAELGEAPLALSLEHLAVLADTTGKPLAAGSAEELASGYTDQGWKADDAVLSALASVDKANDYKAVCAAIRSVYLPWAEDSARYLQKLIDGTNYPGGSINHSAPISQGEGECILFVDGLRFDAGKRLVKLLKQSGFDVAEEPTWTALPSVTATGKAAVSPVRDKIRGEDTSTDFEPEVATTGQSLKGGYHLKKLLRDSGWKVLDRSDSGDGQGRAWCEFGDIDHEGHDRGWKLARQLDVLIAEIGERTNALLAAGWISIRVVTDHGWLLLPGGLPKIELPSALVESKWGRCASLKQGASCEERLYPWYWNTNQHFALADGISCFKKGEEYAHGGLSLQECLTLRLTVTKGQMANSVRISSAVWKGLTCKVAVDGEASGLIADIRMKPGDAASSVAVKAKPLKKDGTASVIVEDEDLEGCGATLVLIDDNGVLVAQVATVIGGGDG